MALAVGVKGLHSRYSATTHLRSSMKHTHIKYWFHHDQGQANILEILTGVGALAPQQPITIPSKTLNSDGTPFWRELSLFKALITL